MLTSRLRLVRPVNDGRGPNVWLADHLALAARVEVTFAEVTASDALSARDPMAARDQMAARARAFAEIAEIAARINDPHVVPVLEQGEVNGVPFVVTKALEGRSLRQRLLHGPASLEEVQQLVRDAAGTLGKAHSLGIAHGRWRPDCLFTTEVGGQSFLAITGFGETDSLGADVRSSRPAPSALPAEHPYASPEQLLHATASDVRSDLWSFAVTVYELLTTTLPFEAATPAGVTVAICNAEFAKPSLYRADLPPGIDGWFELALAKDPARRFRDAAEFAQSFESALAAPAVQSIAPPLPSDSLDMDDDDGDDDEKTVKWDMPEDARAIALGTGGAAPLLPAPLLPAPLLPAPLLPAPLLPAPLLPVPADGLQHGPSAAPFAPNLAMVSKPGPVSKPPRASVGALALPSTLPPTLEPGVYLDSTYMPSAMSVLAVPAAAPEGLRVRRPFFGVEGPLFTPDKTWLAALAFAAGVAVTWFAYDAEPGAESGAGSAARDDGEIRTLSVDDLPRVDGDEGENLRIIPTHQLPRAADEVEVEPVAGRAPPSERPVVSAQKVHALSPAAPKAPAAAAAPARAKASNAVANCNPPYYFDNHGIRRIKAECLNGTGVIQGPYGAVLKTTASGKSSNEQQARATTSCSPPYYFDGKIRRLKLECL